MRPRSSPSPTGCPATFRAALASKFLPEFGLSTECGLGRHSPVQLDRVADAVAELFGTKTPALA